MKKSLKTAGIVLTALLMASPAFCKSEKKMYVSVGTLIVKDGTSLRAKQVTKLAYGDEVLVQEENGKYCLIVCKQQSGWVPVSSLTKKKISTKSKSTSADAKEIALAGKGFNSSIEAAYAKENKIDFSLIDRIEKSAVTEADTISFMEAGKLNLGE